eukprot:6660404-Ditylum_brightwellii.AAC.1
MKAISPSALDSSFDASLDVSFNNELDAFEAFHLIPSSLYLCSPSLKLVPLPIPVSSLPQKMLLPC